MIERVLVALDGSDHADRALDLACQLAHRFEAALIVLHVVSDEALSSAEREMAEVEFHVEVARSFDIRRFADADGDSRLMSQRLTEQAAETARRFRAALGERLLDDARMRAGQAGVEAVRTLVREGDPAKGILLTAQKEKVDMIILGRRGLGDLAGLLLGSVSHKVTHLTECACLTVK